MQTCGTSLYLDIRGLDISLLQQSLKQMSLTTNFEKFIPKNVIQEVAEKDDLIKLFWGKTQKFCELHNFRHF